MPVLRNAAETTMEIVLDFPQLPGEPIRIVPRGAPIYEYSTDPGIFWDYGPTGIGFRPDPAQYRYTEKTF